MKATSVIIKDVDDHRIDRKGMSMAIPAHQRRIEHDVVVVEPQRLLLEGRDLKSERGKRPYLAPLIVDMGPVYGVYAIEACQIGQCCEALETMISGRAHHTRIKFGVNYDLHIIRMDEPGLLDVTKAQFLLWPENAETFEPLVLSYTALRDLERAFGHARDLESTLCEKMEQVWKDAQADWVDQPGERDYRVVKTPDLLWELLHRPRPVAAVVETPSMPVSDLDVA